VTLSGGEPLVWPEFCVELLGRLRARGVDTCIETTALASEEVFDRVSAQLDHLLIDMKHWDPARHEAGTGVGDERILANTARAIAAGKDVLVRIPVIPGFNDSPEDARGFCRRLREVGASRVQLLPFHQFGESKYETLEYDYDYAGVPSLSEDALEAYRQTFVGRGVDAFF
jgi:pyruvate formate lyase activating enzyme